MKIKYGFNEFIKNIISLFYTKIFFKKARLIRLPFYLRGNRKNFIFGKNFTTGYCSRIELFGDGKIILGDNCKIGDRVHITTVDKITIGDNCLMASDILISDNSHGIYSGDGEHSSPNEPPDNRKLYAKSVFIGKNVWIGDNCRILNGVNIGDGCIIGAGSVVTKNIPKNSIVAGIPGRIIKQWNENEKRWEKIK